MEGNNHEEIVKLLDGIDESLRAALNKKGRKVTMMENHIIDIDIQLAQLRELVAPETVKYAYPF